MKSFSFVCLAFLVTLLSVPPSFAGEFTIFGPAQFSRETGTPATQPHSEKDRHRRGKEREEDHHKGKSSDEHPSRDYSQTVVSFESPLAGSDFILKLQNGDAAGKNRVSSGIVKVNGDVVIEPSDLNRHVGTEEEDDVALVEGTNELSVLLRSKPGAFVLISERV